MGKRGAEAGDKGEGNNSYAIGELAGQAGVTPRTVRFYVAEGLLPPPEGAGRGALYTADHLRRLELIKLLKEEFLPLAQIRDLLAGLSRAAIEDLLAQKRKPAPPPQPESAREYIQALLRTGPETKERPAMLRQVVASRKRAAAVPSPPPASEEAVPASGVETAVTWGRISLHPDVELSVRQSPTDPRTPARVQQLLAVARRLFKVRI
jgi:DNA-binding transcriptional MerR regulator